MRRENRERARRTGRTVRGAVLAVCLVVLFGLVGLPAQAIDFATDDGAVVAPTKDACATISTPRPYEVWFNMDDMDQRGFSDPGNQEPWDYAKKVAQIICGAKQGAQIKVGMFFIRAIGTLDRPESDPEVIWQALEYVHNARKVSIEMVLDGGSITSASGKAQVKERLSAISTIYWCTNGCYETNPSDVLPNSINHEKFITISDTTWSNSAAGPHPAVYSSSANISRGQVRNYWEESTLIYDDLELYNQFSGRFMGMKVCAQNNCPTSDQFPATLQLVKSSGVWVDPIYRHRTDAGRGTTVSFSPQPQTARDYYSQQFDDVDCKVDKIVRVSMFRLSDTRADQFIRAVQRLSGRGCDVRILLSPTGGAVTISTTTAKKLYDAGIPVRCSAVPLHTKMVLIGSTNNNYGRVLFGTVNLSTSGLRYSDEHVITVDSRRTTPAFEDDARRLYGQFLAAWHELNRGSVKCATS